MSSKTLLRTLHKNAVRADLRLPSVPSKGKTITPPVTLRSEQVYKPLVTPSPRLKAAYRPVKKRGKSPVKVLLAVLAIAIFCGLLATRFTGENQHSVKSNSQSNVKSEYDDAGNEVKKTFYHEDGTIDFVSAFEYDSAGNVTKNTYYDSEGVIESETEYDSAGHKVKTAYYQDGFLSFADEFDSAGSTTKRIFYREDGSIESETEYDSTGDKSTFYRVDGSIYSVSEFDSQDNLKKTTYYREDGTMDYWVEDDENGFARAYNADGTARN